MCFQNENENVNAKKSSENENETIKMPSQMKQITLENCCVLVIWGIYKVMKEAWKKSIPQLNCSVQAWNFSGFHSYLVSFMLMIQVGHNVYVKKGILILRHQHVIRLVLILVDLLYELVVWLILTV